MSKDAVRTLVLLKSLDYLMSIGIERFPGRKNNASTKYKQVRVIIDRSAKCHPETEGEITEYSWVMHNDYQ